MTDETVGAGNRETIRSLRPLRLPAPGSRAPLAVVTRDLLEVVWH
ncbi:hypothetical protein [Gordonia sp. SL306]|nr:hypothetical protein [Gordonia sp. SL306]WAC55557.1 hypothetical protein OVA31_23750 [Gordonia sp. SL306]